MNVLGRQKHLAIVPVLGAFTAWFPAVYLALEGVWLDAAVLVGWGGIIIMAGIDNLLYPVLFGRKLRLHTVVAFIGAVGGVLWLCPSGLVLGPAVVSVTLLLVAFARKRLEPAETSALVPARELLVTTHAAANRGAVSGNGNP